MLQTISLSKQYGSHQALAGLSVQIAPGEVFCMLGANGAGKTTSIKLMLGLLTPSAGQVLVHGVDVHRDPLAARRQMLYLPEQIALYGEMSGLENLDYFAGLAGVGDRRPSLLLEWLHEAGIPEDAAHRRAATYSKGMRQKVAIALAIARSARVLLLDEPTSGLDPQASAEFHALLLRQRDAGAAIYMATHDLFRAREVATTIGLMRGGHLVRTLKATDVSALELERLYLDEMRAPLM
ncbi:MULTISPECIES: ABC transporter ATP-binding protein [unclassified Duganella]|uniref:ABC transporter ATP-binding protein n=1 Tax=unclassified Duganella TaxID=2636909 RepID=UPI0008863482|nr:MULTISPECIES: ABC transporter ATP-binding protein [unclassified Duganella]SDF74215.1 ABC-2 type transport system ATP-binding protein [Duganella sp. OV458]SDI55279.1 ABC-2 type transport system ATP-binding protein [Duganella sp. OV510]